MLKKLKLKIEYKLVDMAIARLEATRTYGIRSRWSQGFATGCEPDFIIGQGDGGPYLLRWFVIPRNPFFNIYLHCFLRSDLDFALHSHPWLFNASWLWRGPGYFELVPCGKKEALRYVSEDIEPAYFVRCDNPKVLFHYNHDWKFRWGKSFHRVELLPDPKRADEVQIQWTIFITGPKIRSWGFMCKSGFKHFKKVVNYKKGDGAEHKGCPE